MFVTLAGCVLGLAMQPAVRRTPPDTLISTRGDTTIVHGDTLIMIPAEQSEGRSRGRMTFIVGPKSVELLRGSTRTAIHPELAQHARNLADEIRFNRRLPRR